MHLRPTYAKSLSTAAALAALSVLRGCVPFPTFSPSVAPFRVTEMGRPITSNALVLAQYSDTGAPEIDAPGPSAFRLRLLKPDSDGVYRVPVERSTGVAGFFVYVPFFITQAKPSIFVLLSDGRLGSTEPESCKFGRVPALRRSAGTLIVPEQSAAHPMGGLKRLAMECLFEMFQSEKQWNGLLSRNDARTIGEFVLANPDLTDEVGLVIWRRIAFHADEPIAGKNWGLHWVGIIWSKCPETLEELRVLLPADEQERFFGAGTKSP